MFCALLDKNCNAVILFQTCLLPEVNIPDYASHNNRKRRPNRFFGAYKCY